MFDCRQCWSRDCKREWTLPVCRCDGKDLECKVCGGTGKQRIGVCVRKYATQEGFMVQRYFQEWYNLEGRYPDGGPSLFQPVKLVLAFDLLARYKDAIKTEPAKKPVKGKR